MTMIKLSSASHPPVAERVNAKHYAEVDPEAPDQDRPPLLRCNELGDWIFIQANQA